MKRYLRFSLVSACIVSMLTALFFTFVHPFAPSPVAHADTGFVSRCGIHFCLSGHPYYFAGADAYDLFTYGNGDASSSTTPNDIETKFMDKTKIDAMMQAMEDDHVMVVRTWLFDHEQWHGFEPAKGVYNEAEFDEFDYIIQSAIAHHIKVLPTLENFWSDYGGIATRLQWEGLPNDFNNSWRFFNHDACPGCFTQYQNYVNHVLNHVNHYSNIAYKNEPNVFAWELMNEPRYQNATPNENSTGTTLRAWVDTMASYIKGIDPNHMVDAGIEGHGAKYGFGGDEGNPFVNIQQSPYIDFTSAHPYPTANWANLTIPQTRSLIDQWISDSHNVVGKPFFMGEYNVEKTSTIDRSAWWQAMQSEIESAGGDGDAFWNYMLKNDGGNLTVAPGDPALTVFHQHSLNMQAKNGGGGITPTPNPTNTPTPIPTTNPTPTPTPIITPTPTPTGATCRVQYVIQNQWPGGFTGNITITNTGSTSINGWALRFSFPGGQVVQTGWNGTYTQQASQVTVINVGYNASIPANQSTGIGFNASWNGSNPIPTSFTLNGKTCSTS